MSLMATQEDVREIVTRLPGAVESPEHFAFSVEVKGKHKGFAWVWMERVTPKKPRVANPGVLAIVVPGLAAKEVLMGSGSDLYVDDPHYKGFPAVLVRLEAIDRDLLEDLLIEAWKTKATPVLLKAYRENGWDRSDLSDKSGDLGA
jgi:hypothetical protein